MFFWHIPLRSSHVFIPKGWQPLHCGRQHRFRAAGHRQAAPPDCVQPGIQSHSPAKKFLQFVVEKTLEGQADEIKGYTVATSIFGRKETSPAAFHDALEALEHAAIKEPGCPQVWTYLGGLYCENYGLEIVDLETPIEKGVKYTEKGVQLNPSSQRARIWLAEARLLNNQLPEGLVEAKKALALNPSSLIYLGRLKEGNRNIEEILKLKPDFPVRGRSLIKYFIKSDELVEGHIEGLKKSGLDLK